MYLQSLSDALHSCNANRVAMQSYADSMVEHAQDCIARRMGPSTNDVRQMGRGGFEISDVPGRERGGF